MDNSPNPNEQEKRNIYLIGMMGSGKTVTGIALASLTGKQFVDIDDVIQNKERCSINEIFTTKGEDYFRQLERDAIAEISKQNNLIVATSGGVVLNSKNVANMQGSGDIIHLQASLPTLWERVQDKKDRPLLLVSDPFSTLSKIYEDRISKYKQVTEKEVSTEARTPRQVANDIKRYFIDLDE